jgi:hypothetical protein
MIPAFQFIPTYYPVWRIDAVGRAQARDRGATTAQYIPTSWGPERTRTQGGDGMSRRGNERKIRGEEMGGGREDTKWEEQN